MQLHGGAFWQNTRYVLKQPTTGDVSSRLYGQTLKELQRAHINERGSEKLLAQSFTKLRQLVIYTEMVLLKKYFPDQGITVAVQARRG